MKPTGTPATVFLAEHGVAFTEHHFEYVEHGGTAHTSESLGVPEHQVVKTLIMENEKGEPLVVLMHGDRKVSTKALARAIGGTSPFGTRKGMPVFLERSVLDLPRIYINGGRRGYLLGMDSAELVRVLSPALVEVALEE